MSARHTHSMDGNLNWFVVGSGSAAHPISPEAWDMIGIGERRASVIAGSEIVARGAVATMRAQHSC